jgi:trimeric autotransporter adhesin
VAPTLVFDVSVMATRNPYADAHASGAKDWVVVSATADVDFGWAPPSYDQGDAARATLSDIRLGSTVVADRALDAAVSPNAPESPDAGNDGFSEFPELRLGHAGSEYAVAFTMSGASRPGTVCGWIDFDRNGRFDEEERACTDVAPGQTVGSLSWIVPGR